MELSKLNTYLILSGKTCLKLNFKNLPLKRKYDDAYWEIEFVIKKIYNISTFYSTVGQKTKQLETNLGDHELWTRNPRGENIMDYFKQKDLHAINIYFNKML